MPHKTRVVFIPFAGRNLKQQLLLQSWPLGRYQIAPYTGGVIDSIRGLSFIDELYVYGHGGAGEDFLRGEPEDGKRARMSDTRSSPIGSRGADSRRASAGASRSMPAKAPMSLREACGHWQKSLPYICIMLNITGYVVFGAMKARLRWNTRRECMLTTGLV